MKRYLSILIAVMLCGLLVACENGDHSAEKVVSSYPGGDKKETAIFEEGTSGQARIKSFEYYASGEKKKEFNYRDNHFFGPWTFWYLDGKKLAEGVIETKTLDHQKAFGHGSYFWPSGTKMIEIVPQPDQSGSQVTAVYDEAGQKYSAEDRPKLLAKKIQELLANWEKGTL